jgi:phosphatidylglycerophosphate synthase
MTIHVQLIRENTVRLWGLSSRERLRRMLNREGVIGFVDEPTQVPPRDSVLVLRGDYVYDQGIIAALVAAVDRALLDPHSDTLVGAHVKGSQAAVAIALLQGSSDPTFPSPPTLLTPDTWSADPKLRKRQRPLLQPVTQENRTAVKRQLFGQVYKGVTDLVTKWIWPLPARWITDFCARLGIRPNQVTALSWILAILTALLFAFQAYAWGLVLGWMMTFLDTVDGKLARVTVSYTRFGDRFDHLLDLIHPPLWYLAWGVGLAAFESGTLQLSLESTMGMIFAGYILGRLAEGSFTRWLGGFSIFIWRPIDSLFRLVTARRNPSLILLSASVLLDRPDLGLIAVALWTLASTLFLLLRVTIAWFEWRHSGALASWLEAPDTGAVGGSLARRWFSD